MNIGSGPLLFTLLATSAFSLDFSFGGGFETAVTFAVAAVLGAGDPFETFSLLVPLLVTVFDDLEDFDDFDDVLAFFAGGGSTLDVLLTTPADFDGTAPLDVE